MSSKSDPTTFILLSFYTYKCLVKEETIIVKEKKHLCDVNECARETWFIKELYTREYIYTRSPADQYRQQALPNDTNNTLPHTLFVCYARTKLHNTEFPRLSSFRLQTMSITTNNFPCTIYHHHRFPTVTFATVSSMPTTNYCVKCISQPFLSLINGSLRLCSLLKLNMYIIKLFIIYLFVKRYTLS